MQVTMTVRTDAQLKATFTALCEEFGMNANTAMNIFMRAVAETKSIPFTIGRKKQVDEVKDVRQQLGDILEQNRQRLIAMNEPEHTLEEINAEIAAARAERKARLAKEATV